MHLSALHIGRLVLEHYLPLEPARVLEIGSFDVNGTLRNSAPPTAEYVGLDFEAGPGVDCVVKSGEPWPVEDNSFDLVLATSALEHDPAFWMTFLEMCRKAKDGGFIYINAPSNGVVHRYPQDAWRFYPDSGQALAQWANSQGLDIHLVESFTAARDQDIWNDFVAVFRKSGSSRHIPKGWIYDSVPSSNVWVEHAQTMLRETTETEDMQLLRAAIDGQTAAQDQLGEVHALLDRERETLAALEHELAQAKGETSSLAERLAHAHSEIAQRQEEISQANADHDHTRAELDHARAELELSRAAVIRLQEELAESNGWVFKLAAERKEAEDRCNRLSREVTLLERQLLAEQRAHERTADEASRVELRLRADQQALERSADAMNAQLADLQRLSEGLKAQVDDLVSRNRHIAAQCDSLADAHASSVEENQRVSNQLDQRYQEIATLTKMLLAREREAEEQLARAEWLRQVAALSMTIPLWWHFLPRAARRARELRRLARRGLFDAQRYYDLNPDVREEGMDALQHYILHGLAEGRAV